MKPYSGWARSGDRTSLRRDSGAALVSTILAIGFLLMTGALAANQARTSLLIQQRARESLEALVAAETGLAAAIADFHYEPRFERLDLADESGFPYSSRAASGPLPSSFDVDVHVRRRSPRHIDVVATSRGRNRARRRLIATVRQTDRPYVPAAFFSTSARPAISGGDRLRIAGDESTTNGVPALGFPTDDAATSSRDSLLAGGASLAGRPIAAATDWSRLDESIRRLKSLGNRRQLPGDANGHYGEAIWVSSASVTVSSASGSGIWLVDGDLRIAGNFEFSGLLFVAGDILFAETSTVRISGSLIQAPPGAVLQAAGDTTIRYDPDALARVESLRPNIVDRRGEIIGWRDDS